MYKVLTADSKRMNVTTFDDYNRSFRIILSSCRTRDLFSGQGNKQNSRE